MNTIISSSIDQVAENIKFVNLKTDNWEINYELNKEVAPELFSLSDEDLIRAVFNKGVELFEGE